MSLNLDLCIGLVAEEILPSFFHISMVIVSSYCFLLKCNTDSISRLAKSVYLCAVPRFTDNLSPI